MEADTLVGELLDKEIQLKRINSELERQNETLKLQIELRDQLNNQVAEVKAKLKEILPKGTIKKRIGEDELYVNLSSYPRASVEDFAKVPQEYISETELTNVIERDGKFYQLEGNCKRVENEVSSGADCPPGFSVKITKRLSLKFNGKPL